MKKSFPTLLSLTLAAAWIAGCGSTPNVGSVDERQMQDTKVQSAISRFKEVDPSMQHWFDKSYAYAVYPEVVTAAVGLGGGHGNGEVFSQGRLIGYTDLSQGNIGLQLGGQKYSEIIFFENQEKLQEFQRGTFEFDARATAVAASNGAGAAADYAHGVLIFCLPESGLMAQAAIGGQKFRYTPANEVSR